MKDWMCWTLLVIGVIAIACVSYWLSHNMPIMWSIGTTIFCNFLVSCYLTFRKSGREIVLFPFVASIEGENE